MKMKQKQRTLLALLLAVLMLGSFNVFGLESTGQVADHTKNGHHEYQKNYYGNGSGNGYGHGHDYGDYEGGYGYGDRNDREDGPGVYLYKHANFRGSRVFIRAGRNIRNLRSLGWNDKVSSIELVDGARIQIYEHANYQGGRATLYRDSTDLARIRRGTQGNWNDKISSIKVIHGSRSRHYDDYRDDYNDRAPVIFYKHANRRGSSFVGKLGRDRKVKKSFNDEVSSVWVKSGYKLVLYEHSNFGGRRVVLEGTNRRFGNSGGSLYNLADYNFNDRMSSYIVERSDRRFRFKR
jgi:hypothetical protein